MINRQRIGLLLIALGVCVWLIYAALRMSGIPVNGGVALAIHLTFVIPGAVLAPGENLYARFFNLFRRDKSREESQ